MTKTPEQCQAIVKQGYKAGKQCGAMAIWVIGSGLPVCGNHKYYSPEPDKYHGQGTRVPIPASLDAITDTTDVVRLPKIRLTKPAKPPTSLSDAKAAASDPNADSVFLQSLADDTRKSVRILAAQNPNLEAHKQQVLLNDESPEVRKSVVSNTNCPHWVLEHAAWVSDDTELSIAALDNDNMPTYVIMNLASMSPKASVRSAARERLYKRQEKTTDDKKQVKPHFDNATRMAIAQRALNGENQGDLAKEFNLSRGTIGRWVKKYFGTTVREARGKSETGTSDTQAVKPQTSPVQDADVEKPVTVAEKMQAVFDAKGLNGGRTAFGPTQISQTLVEMSRRGDPEDVAMLTALRSSAKKRFDSVVHEYATEVWDKSTNGVPTDFEIETSDGQTLMVKAGKKSTEWLPETFELAAANVQTEDQALALFRKSWSTSGLKELGINVREYAEFRPKQDGGQKIQPDIETLAQIHKLDSTREAAQGLFDTMDSMGENDPIMAKRTYDALGSALKGAERNFLKRGIKNNEPVVGDDDIIYGTVREEGYWGDYQHDELRRIIRDSCKTSEEIVRKMEIATRGQYAKRSLEGLVGKEAVEEVTQTKISPTRLVAVEA